MQQDLRMAATAIAAVISSIALTTACKSDGLGCSDGRCNTDGPRCISTDDCVAGHFCNNGACVRLCNRDADCAAGQMCDNGACTTGPDEPSGGDPAPALGDPPQTAGDSAQAPGDDTPTSDPTGSTPLSCADVLPCPDGYACVEATGDLDAHCTLQTCADIEPCDSGETCVEATATESATCIALSSCGNAVVESGEQCDDGNDARFDGCKPDCTYEDNRIVVNGVADFDVDDEGNLFIVRQSHGDDVEALCLDPNGRARRAWFLIAQDAWFNESLSVHVAKQTGIAWVTWRHRTDRMDWSTERAFSQAFDAQCQPLAPPVEWPDFSTRVAAAAVDAVGNFVTVSHTDSNRNLVHFYDATGRSSGEVLDFLEQQTLGCTSVRRIALNPSTGAGVVTCQRQWFQSIMMRRFSAERVWVDPAPIAVAGSENENDGSGHAIGMANDGSFVVEWKDRRLEHRYLAAFYDGDGALIARHELRPIADDSAGFNTFAGVHQGVPTLGSGFVLRTRGPRTSNLLLYGGDGRVLGCQQVVPDSASLRVSDRHTFLYRPRDVFDPTSAGEIRVDDVQLDGYFGCVAPTCGDGVLDTFEECDDVDGDDGDECVSTCRFATCGDRFVQIGVEQCDGNDLDWARCSDDCTVVCSPLRGNCDGELNNGCETDLATNPSHCGACASPCATECVDGVCSPS